MREKYYRTGAGGWSLGPGLGAGPPRYCLASWDGRPSCCVDRALVRMLRPGVASKHKYCDLLVIRTHKYLFHCSTARSCDNSSSCHHPLRPSSTSAFIVSVLPWFLRLFHQIVAHSSSCFSERHVMEFFFDNSILISTYLPSFSAPAFNLSRATRLG